MPGTSGRDLYNPVEIDAQRFIQFLQLIRIFHQVQRKVCQAGVIHQDCLQRRAPDARNRHHVRRQDHFLGMESGISGLIPGMLSDIDHHPVIFGRLQVIFLLPIIGPQGRYLAQRGAPDLPADGPLPILTRLVDYAGLANFSLHLVEYPDELQELYEALRVNFHRIVEIAAGGPGHYLNVIENFTADTLGPRRYKQFLLPVYEETFNTLHQAGKIVGCHYDGKIKAVKDLVAGSPIDLIESLTPPPEGDMTLAEARAVWPDKLFWANINLGCYELASDELKQEMWRRVQDGAPDGCRLAFEVSEDRPARWRESMPVILAALNEMG